MKKISGRMVVLLSVLSGVGVFCLWGLIDGVSGRQISRPVLWDSLKKPVAQVRMAQVVEGSNSRSSDAPNEAAPSISERVRELRGSSLSELAAESERLERAINDAKYVERANAGVITEAERSKMSKELTQYQAAIIAEWEARYGSLE
jgi:hypothetical protein